MGKFQIYDVVRVVSVPLQISHSGSQRRVPRVGDTGAVVMAYDSPSEGYTVEAVAADGVTEWLLDFGPGDLERLST